MRSSRQGSESWSGFLYFFFTGRDLASFSFLFLFLKAVVVGGAVSRPSVDDVALRRFLTSFGCWLFVRPLRPAVRFVSMLRVTLESYPVRPPPVVLSALRHGRAIVGTPGPPLSGQDETFTEEHDRGHDAKNEPRTPKTLPLPPWRGPIGDRAGTGPRRTSRRGAHHRGTPVVPRL